MWYAVFIKRGSIILGEGESSMDRTRITRLILSFSVLISVLLPVMADRGMVPLSGVSIYGPGQKAIVAWNGFEEVLILSTDVYAEEESKVLEFLPLPSRPDLINATDFSPFESVQDLLNDYGNLKTGSRGKLDDGGIEIIFHEEIGAHDITVVRVDDSDDFQSWANRFLEDSGISGRVSGRDLSRSVDSYISKGYSFFVLDLIQASPERRSVEPLIYRFKSDHLYFPLEVSRLASGSVDITLFTVTGGPIYEEDLHHKLSLANRQGPLRRPVRFRLAESRLDDIHPKIGDLFHDDVWLSVVEYHGELDNLDFDLALNRIQTPTGDILVISPFFWIGSGVALGILMGIVISQLNMGLLRLDFKRLVASIDFIIVFLLMILASVMSYSWSGYVFWILVPLAILTLYFAIRSGDKKIMLIYILLPILGLTLIFTVLYAHLLEMVMALVFFLGFLLAAAFPPNGERSLSRAFSRSSRWIKKSRRRGSL